MKPFPFLILLPVLLAICPSALAIPVTIQVAGQSGSGGRKRLCSKSFRFFTGLVGFPMGCPA